MKINNVLVFLVILMTVSSCYVPTYVPKVTQAAENIYGAYIKVTLLNGNKIHGELLASNPVRITVLREGREYPTQIATKGIKDFTAKYAKSTVGSLSLVNLLLPISHGKLLIATLPINAVAVSILMGASNEDYKVFSDEITYQELRKYARYPQGLPPVYKINSLDR